MTTFYLTVTNPVVPSTAWAFNVNWEAPGYDYVDSESLPDVMPTANSAVTFTSLRSPGHFVLAFSTGGPGRWTNSLSSPSLVPVEGQTYIWDMASNVVTVGSSPGGGPGKWLLIGGAIFIAARLLKLI